MVSFHKFACQTASTFFRRTGGVSVFGGDCLLTMTITANQLRSLRVGLRETFYCEMSRHLRESFPMQVGSLSDDELLVRIDSAAQSAECYGLVTEAQVCAYLELEIVHGQDFDMTASTFWAGRVLRNPRLSGDQKVEALENYELFRG